MLVSPACRRKMSLQACAAANHVQHCQHAGEACPRCEQNRGSPFPKTARRCKTWALHCDQTMCRWNRWGQHCAMTVCRSRTIGSMLFQDGVQLQDLPVRFKHAAVAGPAAPAAPAGPAELARLRLQPARHPRLTARPRLWRCEAAGGPAGPRAPTSGCAGRPGGPLAQEAVVAPLLDGCRRQHASMSNTGEASMGAAVHSQLPASLSAMGSTCS